MLGLSKLSAIRSEDALKHKENDTALYFYETAKMLRINSGPLSRPIPAWIHFPHHGAHKI